MNLETVPVAIEKGQHKSQDFLKMNPAGQVPVFVEDAMTLCESHAIMKYLVGKVGGSALYPADEIKRAHIDQWLDWTHAALNPPVQAIAIHRFAMGDNPDEDFIAENSQNVGSALAALNTAFETGGSISDTDHTLAHIAIATTLSLYEQVGGQNDGAPRVDRWYDTIKKRASFRQSAPKAA